MRISEKVWLAVLAFAISQPVFSQQNISSVVDDAGRNILLKSNATLIVSLSPALTEMFYFLGLGDKLVARDVSSNYPEQAHKLPVVGSVTTLKWEKIMMLKPDLVLIWGQGLPQTWQEKFKQFGWPYYVSNPKSLAGIAKNMRDMVMLTGENPAATSRIEGWESEIDEMRKQFSTEKKHSAIYQMWHKPVFVSGAESIVSDVFNICGLRNAYADQQIAAFPATVESVLKRKPEILVYSLTGSGDSPSWLSMWSKYGSLPFVKNHRQISIKPDILQRHGPRLLDATRELCHKVMALNL